MSTLDSMLAVIEPEMPRQIERWGGTMEEWEENVQDLKDFISDRCLLFDEGMVECFDLTGPYTWRIRLKEGNNKMEWNTHQGPIASINFRT